VARHVLKGWRLDTVTQMGEGDLALGEMESEERWE
jgi:hypothetical protein